MTILEMIFRLAQLMTEKSAIKVPQTVKILGDQLFFDIGLIWFRFVRRTFHRQFQKSPYLVTISSHSWDCLKPNFSALYLEDNQNKPSQIALETKVPHLIFKEQKKFLNYLKLFKSYRALESAISSWDTLYSFERGAIQVTEMITEHQNHQLSERTFRGYPKNKAIRSLDSEGIDRDKGWSLL